MASTITILQINLNRCRIAHDLMERTIAEKNIIVTLGQEPYGKGRTDFHDVKGDSFINVDNEHEVIKSGSGEGFVYVELSTCIFLSCYFSPNGELADFERLLQNIESMIRHQGKHVVMGGDLNAKTNIIGSQTTNQRGAILQEWILANGLVILNEGDTPTFQNANGTSIIDFTAATEQLGRRVDKWRVEPDIENFGDHNNIYFEVSCKPGENTTRPSQAGWTIKPAAITELAAAWKTSHQTKRGQYNTIRTLTSDIVKLLDKYGHKKSSSSGRPPVYWWNADIANLRRACSTSRRKLTRARKSLRTYQQVHELTEEHKHNNLATQTALSAF
ncbi:uncharacterized protein LOC125505391 [Dendroctonus ponderosae]|uniref:uncharacterized protein LOC125505391 n=1 Tax=Dendroctonus ponderosae TaxID=77166 RepID=UPI002034BEA2|nr:uncharacterized protein LOC125505391 [Dendroctonus ponderosae]